MHQEISSNSEASLQSTKPISPPFTKKEREKKKKGKIYFKLQEKGGAIFEPE